MNWKRWTALCACTLLLAWLSWAGLPPGTPLVPSHGLRRGLRAAAVMAAPQTICHRLEKTALVRGMFDYDPAVAAAALSDEARGAGLPALKPPVRAPAELQAELDQALDWLRPAAAAAIVVDADGRRELWLGAQGGRVAVLGRLAGWVAPGLHCTAGNGVWLRLSSQPTPGGATGATAGAAATDARQTWARETDADVAVLLPEGLPPLLSASGAGPAAAGAPPRADPLATAFAAAGLPAGIGRMSGSVWVDADRFRWAGEYAGEPATAGNTSAATSTAAEATAAAVNPPARAELPARGTAGVFLTLRCDLDWPRLYHGLVDGMSADQRADFLRSMRYYRMAEKGYKQPEADLINVLGCGVAMVGRRGAEYAGSRLMPSLQAEIPLKPEPPRSAPTEPLTPNQIFRMMMPDFAEARFDKIRRVGESSYAVHPSYVAVTVGSTADRYVLVRPSIAGSALLPAWQVDEQRIKIGTRPDVLEAPDLLAIAGSPAMEPAGSPAGERIAGRVGEPPATLALYFDPSAITEQLDHFRILVMVEGGADRPTPDSGVNAAEIEKENAAVVKQTQANMELAAEIGWVLERLGPLTFEAGPTGGAKPGGGPTAGFFAANWD